MRLSEFIKKHHEELIAEWVGFASTLLPWAKGMSATGLRDHASELLIAVVSDMQQPQSDGEQCEKSRGQGAAGELAKVGHRHASQRLGTGFNLDQLVSEYRALRASILRRWARANGEKQDEVTRFNEAIDESLSEAAVRYSEILDRTREQFLAILGHDLRDPLTAIVMGATALSSAENLDDKQARVATRILTSASRMGRMVNDLLDLTRTRLGDGIPVTPKPMDLTHVCKHVVAELEAVHPDCKLSFEASGDLQGEWDSDRLAQVVSNLVANALQYGSDGCPVKLVAEAQAEHVVIRVQNRGPQIPEAALKTLFEPLTRVPGHAGENNPTGLGLGLYIARGIVLAHGGTIEVTSTAKAGTTFTVQLPRHPPANVRATG